MVYQTVILSYLCLNEDTKALDWLERGVTYLKERHIEYLKTCPAFTPSFELFRQDPRFKALVHDKREHTSQSS